MAHSIMKSLSWKAALGAVGLPLLVLGALFAFEKREAKAPGRPGPAPKSAETPAPPRAPVIWPPPLPEVKQPSTQVKAPGPAERREEPAVALRPESLAPENTVAFLESRETAPAKSNFRQSPLGRLCSPAEGESLVSRLLPLPRGAERVSARKRSERWQELLGRLGSLLDLSEGTLALAVFPRETAAPAEAALPGAPARTWAAALFLEVPPAKRARAEEELQRMGRGAALTGPLESKPGEHQGVVLRSLSRPELGEVAYAFLDNLLVVGFGRGCLEKVVDVRQGRARQLSREGKLALQKARELIPADDLHFLLRPAELVKALPLPEERKGISALLEGWQGVCGAVRFSTEGVVEKLALQLSENSPLRNLISAKALEHRAARFIPPDAFCYRAVALELEKLWGAIKQLSEALPQAARREVFTTLKQMEEALGVNWEKQVLSALGNEAAGALSLVPGRLEPELLLVLELRQPGERLLAEILPRLEKLWEGSFRSVLYLDQSISIWEGGREKEAARGALPFRIRACASSGNFLLLGSDERVLKKALRQHSTGQSSLLEREAFKERTRPLPAEALELGYLDLGPALDLLYGLLAAAAHKGAPLRAEGLPPAEELKELVSSGLVWASTRTSDGFAWESRSPVGMLSAASLAGTLVLPVLWETEAAREEAQCVANLKRLWRSLELYASDFGHYPITLSELHPTYAQNLAVFQAPGAPVIKSSQEIDEKTRYHYVRGRSPYELSGAIIIYDDSSIHQGAFRHVVELGGRVLALEEAVFQKRLAGREVAAPEAASPRATKAPAKPEPRAPPPAKKPGR